ncbi:hypothetical protein [Massilia sp. Bi118]|uniref:hypothetical protein n=1 Tax=Massilia sp. Bi118 TaxID=2822346 RepID=UPI001E2D29F8|nr:hypothetical protein [Massilia sp. Bi118]
MINDRWMPNWLKFGFVAAFVFFTCWGGAISYWRAPGHNPTAGDLTLYLLGLPSALVLMFFVGYKLITQRKAAEARATAPTSAKANPDLSRVSSLAIMAASLRLPHGTSPEELATAIANDKARADLDKELVDDDGFPILSVRSSEAQDEVLREEITDWLALNGMAEVWFSDEQWRALTLASAVTGELASQAAGFLLPQAKSPLVLELVPVLPVEWNAAHRHAATAWLKQLAAQCGWPANQIIVPKDLADSGALTPSAIFTALANMAGVSNTPTMTMVVACASTIGDETVSRWLAGNALFTSSQPRGQIPGEGAAGVLVTDSQFAQSIEGAAFAKLEAIEEGRHDNAVDESRRIDASLLGNLVEASLKRADMSSVKVDMVIADTGLRSNRVQELMGQVTATMSHLDGKEDVLRVGAACGTCGAVPFVTSLALGRHYVLERDTKVLCIGNEDAFARCVMVMRA